MKKYILSALVAFAFVFASCADSSDPSSSPSPRSSASDKAMQQMEPFEWSASFYNECCDEWIEASATIHVAIKDGVAHFNPTGIVGTGSSGNTYHGGGAEQHTFHFNGAGNYTDHFSLVLTSAGGCHFTIRLHVHFTVDANGNVHVDNITYEVDCN